MCRVGHLSLNIKLMKFYSSKFLTEIMAESTHIYVQTHRHQVVIVRIAKANLLKTIKNNCLYYSLAKSHFWP